MTVRSVSIVGGGTAGLITALILKKRLNITVDVIHSKNIGIVGVGEGSTEHFKEFMTFLGIDHYTLIKECDATYKSGIMFENWGEKNYFHSVAEPFAKKFSQYYYVYAKQISENSRFVSPSALWNNKIDAHHIGNPQSFPSNQFHFNTHKLNDFLISIATSMGINIIEDEILDVTFTENGDIDTLIGEKQKHKYDFYIDSTGFRKVLIGKMGAKWQSYGKYLKMKSAIVFQTGDEDNYNLWTLSKAMDYGWRFKIPVWGRHGNGYIFDSDYIDADQAKAEVEKELGQEINVGKQFKFDPGALDRPWIKNCCAIGLSASFVEPLEASSIGTSIQQAFLLMHRIVHYDEKIINNYNKSINDILENIRDFIALHYATKKTNTQFWVDAGNNNLPDSLKTKLDRWQNKLPIAEDFNSLSDYILFTAPNHILVLDGLNLINRQKIGEELSAHYDYVKKDAEETIKNQIAFESTSKTVSHKEFISIIRNT
jgi:flavin-dependent dehydrogenase